MCVLGVCYLWESLFKYHIDWKQERRAQRIVWSRRKAVGVTYLPGRGQWVTKKAHGLGWWPPLHLKEGCPPKVFPSGSSYVIISCTGGLRSRGPCLFLIKLERRPLPISNQTFVLSYISLWHLINGIIFLTGEGSWVLLFKVRTKTEPYLMVHGL